MKYTQKEIDKYCRKYHILKNHEHRKFLCKCYYIDCINYNEYDDHYFLTDEQLHETLTDDGTFRYELQGSSEKLTAQLIMTRINDFLTKHNIQDAEFKLEPISHEKWQHAPAIKHSIPKTDQELEKEIDDAISKDIQKQANEQAKNKSVKKKKS